MAGVPQQAFGITDDDDWCPEDAKLPTSRGVLSAAEIEMLLRPDLPDIPAVEDGTLSEREIEPLAGSSLETDAALLAAQLTLASRKDCDVDVLFTARGGSISDFSSSPSLVGSNPVLIILERDTDGACAVLGFSGAPAAALVDRIYGGGAAMGLSSVERPRAFSALDRMVLERVLGPLATCIDPYLRVSCVETDPSAAHAVLPPGRAMIAELSCQVGEVRGDAVFARLETSMHQQDRAAPTPNSSGLQTTLIARIASLQVPVSRLASLKAGSTLLLGLPTHQPVELLSGTRTGSLAAEGEVGCKGDKMAVRITRRCGLFQTH
ncbi:MAG: FliM/FliN family flagellar motor switch protein [Pseudomonadota bacterium]